MSSERKKSKASEFARSGKNSLAETGFLLHDSKSNENMLLDLQSIHCVKLSLHSHLPPGEPPRELLVSSCGGRFAKLVSKTERLYSIAGRSYKVAVSLRRSKRDTIVDVYYEFLPEKTSRGRSPLDLGKFWTCLQKVAATPLWHCRVNFEFPSSSYRSQYELPSVLDKPIEGFNEIRGIKLVNSVKEKWVYSVIVDTSPTGDVYYCIVNFTLEGNKLPGLPKEVLDKASEICARVIKESDKQHREEHVG